MLSLASEHEDRPVRIIVIAGHHHVEQRQFGLSHGSDGGASLARMSKKKCRRSKVEFESPAAPPPELIRI
jgi:hypothetical protein